MTGTPPRVSAQLAADDQPQRLRAVPDDPFDANATRPDDVVELPRHVAEAAYRVLQALTALSDTGSLDLLTALGTALTRGRQRRADAPAACRDCGVAVHHGLAHSPACSSDDALLHRGATVPGLAPLD